MKAQDAQQYADALDEINRKVAAGEMTDGAAAVWRQRLTAEMGESSRPGWQKFLIFIVVVVVGLILLRLIGAAFIR